jgi:DNA-binding NtrC family response regulator
MHGNVLIVEDYADWRDLLAGLLQREGYQVEAASALSEARAHLDQPTDLDVAILDVRLVETDETNEEGMHLLAEIRARQPFTRVVMITGHGTMEMQRRAFREFQAFDFFRKEQFDSDEFRRSIQEAVEQAARERAARKDSDYMRGHRYQTWQREKKG